MIMHCTFNYLIKCKLKIFNKPRQIMQKHAKVTYKLKDLLAKVLQQPKLNKSLAKLGLTTII